MRGETSLYTYESLFSSQNPRFAGLKFPDMSRPETLQKKYMGRLAKSALLFMKSLLCMDPELRPNTLASLNHPYFEDLNQQQQMMQQQQMEAKRERQQQQQQQQQQRQQQQYHQEQVSVPSPRNTVVKNNLSRGNNGSNFNQLPVTADSKGASMFSNPNMIANGNRENANNQAKMNVNMTNLVGKKPSSRDANGGLGIAELKKQFNQGIILMIKK